ncbi:MAG: formate dehydrogenase subunit alpha, partial [Burkholderiales bacterium]|nr:formate dehydrogenase subunit alpha [Burkholderiales bacterium]
MVRTNTLALQNLRRNILALMMLEHPSACLVCAKSDLCEQYRPEAEKAGRTTGCHTCNNKFLCDVRALAEELGLSELPIPPSYHHRPVDRSNPFIDRDLNLCILCGRCVRICKHQY